MQRSWQSSVELCLEKLEDVSYKKQLETRHCGKPGGDVIKLVLEEMLSV